GVVRAAFPAAAAAGFRRRPGRGTGIQTRDHTLVRCRVGRGVSRGRYRHHRPDRLRRLGRSSNRTEACPKHRHPDGPGGVHRGADSGDGGLRGSTSHTRNVVPRRTGDRGHRRAVSTVGDYWRAKEGKIVTSVPMMQASQHAEHAAEAVGVPAAEGVTLAYDQHVVSSALDLTLPESGFTVIIGPNGCGRSTLLRAFARLLQPQAGRILIDGKDVRGLRGKDLARKIGFQPQSAIAPDGITVFDLVARGRYPHQSLVSRWSKADAESVHMALAA